MAQSDPDNSMYRWRSLSAAERARTLEYRRRNRLPWHSPAHYQGESELYLLTAAGYEHRPNIGASMDRLAEFEQELLETTRP